MYCKYTDGSLIQLVKARYSRTDPQELTTYHVPLTDINGAIPLGLNWQTWTISGVIADPMSVRWRDIIWLSLDNVSWRACRVQATAFPTNMYQQSLYELTMLVSPILEGAAVRYPSSGYKFGNQSITGISQAGNTPAYPVIHFLAPLFYAPLSNTLLDITGQSVTFTRTAPKTHNGTVYPINTPIFDSGLYLANDTAQDVATWTPPASTVRTIIMQLKSRYPSPWSIGGGGVNLLTANQSNAETDTTGMSSFGTGTFTRNTSAPIAGSGDFKLVSTANGDCIMGTITTPVAVSAGFWYTVQSLVKITAAAGRQIQLGIAWYTAADVLVSQSYGNSVMWAATPTLANYAVQCPATATKAYIWIQMLSSLTGEILYVDSLMIELIPDTTAVWYIEGETRNTLFIHSTWNAIDWSDGATGLEVVLPAAYMVGTVMDVVVIEDTSHAVTIAVHPEGGSWTSATGTLAALTWPQLTLRNLEGSIANLIQYPYVLSSAEYQALAYSSLSLLYNTLYIGNRYAGEIVKGSDKRLLNANGSDISALLGGVDIPIGASAVTIAQSQGLSARWYIELKRTDV